MTAKANEKGYLVNSVDRAIDILEAFTQRQPMMSLGEVAREANLSKATAYRLLTTLQARGLIGKRADNQYFCLGPSISALAAVRTSHTGLLDVSVPEMKSVRDDLDETVSIGSRSGDERVQLYQLEGFRLPRRGSMSGDRSPLYAGASNKLLLAAMSDAEIENYLANGSFRAFTENTIVDRASLWDEVASIRRQGYAESNSEKFLGGASLAAPIYNAERHIIAALSVSIPIERFDDAHKQRCLARIIEAAHSISSELGYRL